MKTMDVIIDIKSPTLLSNGEPEGLYDDTYVRDKNNLPYFPSKRLKGLLRESCLELLEWSGEVSNPEKVIDHIFGKSGENESTTASKVRLKTGKLNQYEAYVSVVNNLNETYGSIQVRNAIDSFFSKKIAQTRIGNDGIAEDKFLRQFKLLNPVNDVKFRVQVELSNSLNDNQKNLVKAGFLNVRRVGTGRNRGWGKVETSIDGIDVSTLAIDWSEFNGNNLNNSKKNEVKIEESTQTGLSGDYKKIGLKIKAESPLIIPFWNGDENTVATKSYIPGSMLWGAFAGRYIQKYTGEHSSNIMNDPVFRALFYNGGLKIRAAFPFVNKKVFYPSPRHWVRSKHETSGVFANMYDNFIPSGKGIGKFVNLNLSEQSEKESYDFIEIEKSQTFHNSRGEKVKARIAGSSQDGGIYYYESLNEGMEFYTELQVDKNLKEPIIKIIKSGKLRIGKSKNNQFGSAVITTIDLINKTNEIKDGDDVDITFLTPTILLNKNGFSDISKEQLGRYLRVENEKIKAIDIRTEPLQLYRGNLNVRLPAYITITPGSSLRVQNVNLNNLQDIRETGIGLETEKGYGQFEVNPVKEEQKLNPPAEPIIQKSEKPSSKALEIEKKLEFQIAIKKAKQKGFEKARKISHPYKNGVYQALSWLASCNGKVNQTNWNHFTNEASKKIKSKFIKYHNLYESIKLKDLGIESSNLLNEEEKSELRYVAALSYVETLKSKLN